MDIQTYIIDRALILIPVLSIVGFFLKNTPHVPDWSIPWILAALGIIGGCAVIGLSADGVIQGVLAAGAAVLGNQLAKQTINKK